ncbi:MAG: hypothetical protein MMC33_010723, partial [Icmadophila ericetorum]|nr:hypothetical protein [Icmadophila ericetorum]
MADPLSITASVVGIAIPALKATQLLLKDLQQLKDAPKTVKRLMEDVQSVNKELALLRGIADTDWELLGAGVDEHAKTIFNSCTQACGLFQTNLQRWTRHSEDGKLAWLDRTSVGFFKQRQIKAMSEQLSNCKLAINSVSTIAN